MTPEVKFDRAAQKESHLGTIQYEIGMLHYSLEWLMLHGPDHEPAEERHVFLEAYLLHYRNLVNFLSGSGGSAGDLTIKKPQVWAESKYTEELIAEISKVAKEAYTAHSGNISTFLAHCTEDRHDRVQQWQPDKMYVVLKPAIDLFMKSFPKNEPNRGQSVVLGPESHSTATIIRYPR